MEHEGPPLESLTRRLAETPDDFLAEPRFGNSGQVTVAAVVSDLFDLLGNANEKISLEAFACRGAEDRKRLGVTLLFCWLLADEWFRKGKLPGNQMLLLLDETAAEMAAQAPPAKLLRDPDRREELARLALARLGYRPAGETMPEAQDRLSSISSSERARVVKAARAAEERARAVREALARKAAEESADKWTRE